MARMKTVSPQWIRAGRTRRPRRAGSGREALRLECRADGTWRGGAYDRPPTAGLRAFARIYAGWEFSQAFYWDHR